MNYTLNLIEKEIQQVQNKIIKQDVSTHLVEDAVVSINKNILKELIIAKQIIRDMYPKLKSFY